MFESYRMLEDGNHFITIPNTKKVEVKLIGQVKFINGIVLTKVLYVPEFQYNLISGRKLCQDLRCNVFFTTSSCFLQDLSMKGSWELGRLEHGLYCLQASSKVQKCFSKDVLSEIFLVKSVYKNSVMLGNEMNKIVHRSLSGKHKSVNKIEELAKAWHLKLGHVPFHKLKIMIPDLSHYDNDSFMCTVCPWLSKQF